MSPRNHLAFSKIHPGPRVIFPMKTQENLAGPVTFDYLVPFLARFRYVQRYYVVKL